MLASRNLIFVQEPPPAFIPGLTGSLLTVSGEYNGWRQQTVDVSAHKNRTVRLVFYYQTTTSFTADLQLDDINIDGNLSTFESSSDWTAWQTTTTNNVNTLYHNAAFSFVDTSNATGRWSRDTGGTGSSGTGLTYDHTLGTTAGGYLYAETSVSPHPWGFWLRSPIITLSNSPTVTFWEARYGATMGTCDVYLDIIG